MNPRHWLEAAEQLVHERRRGAPRQVNLRCAVSMTYYALFHWLASSAADGFAGAARQGDWSWTRAYRGIDHRQVREQCRRGRVPRSLSRTMRRFATELAAMQAWRHQADYDPDVRFSKADAIKHIATASDILTAVEAENPAEKRAFAIHVLFKERPGSP